MIWTVLFSSVTVLLMFTDFHVDDYGRVVDSDDKPRFVLKQLPGNSTHSFAVIDLNDTAGALCWADTFGAGTDIVDALNTAAVIELRQLQTNSIGPCENHPDLRLDNPPQGV